MSCGCLNTIKKGVVGLTKVALQIEIAPMDVTTDRRNICRDCEFATRNKDRIDLPTKGLTSLSRCVKCNCFIKAKTQLIKEVCPIGNW